MKDSFGRKINYARISITDRCNLRCRYCMPEAGIDKKECQDVLRYEKIDEIISVLEKIGINKIRFTGGEPLVRLGVVDFIVKCMEKYKSIDFYLTTNAINFDKYALILKNAGLKGINISLDTFSEDKFREITRGGDLDKALAGLYKAIEVGIPKIKLNAVLTKNMTAEEIRKFAEFTISHNVDVRFIELMPIGDCADYARENYISTNFILESIPELVPVISEDISSPANYYKFPGAKAKLGIISPISCKFCNNCNRIRITADGKLKHCLHSDEEFDLLSGDIEEIILNAVSMKPKEHNLEKNSIKRNMKRIGG